MIHEQLGVDAGAAVGVLNNLIFGHRIQGGNGRMDGIFIVTNLLGSLESDGFPVVPDRLDDNRCHGEKNQNQQQLKKEKQPFVKGYFSHVMVEFLFKDTIVPGLLRWFHRADSFHAYCMTEDRGLQEGIKQGEKNLKFDKFS